jgi:predicted nucleic acid-binding protein
MILVDANVLIDVVVQPSAWTQWSKQRLIEGSAGGLAINLIVYAEIAPCFLDKPSLDLFLSDLAIHTIAMSENGAYLAARAHQAYRKSGGQRLTTLPDFFIGAHALDSQLALLTRDPKRIRTYFPDVVLIAP